MADDIDVQPMRDVRFICRMFDVPIWMVVGGHRPRLWRIRWACRRITGYQGETRAP